MPQEHDSRLRVVHRMRRAFLSICRCGDTLFSPYRITTDQYALIHAVQRNQGIRQADLTNLIFAEPNTVTAMVSLLEKRGILRRKPSPTDKRARLLYLTAHGQALMQRLSEDWDPMRKRLNDCFSGEQGLEALAILDRVYEEMSEARKKLWQPYEIAEKQVQVEGQPKNELLAEDVIHPALNSNKSKPKRKTNSKLNGKRLQQPTEEVS